MAVKEFSAQQQHTSIDYSQIVQSSSFQQLMREKRGFILPSVVEQF